MTICIELEQNDHPERNEKGLEKKKCTYVLRVFLLVTTNVINAILYKKKKFVF